MKSKVFVLRIDQSVKLVSFIRQVLNIDFDGQFVKVRQKLAEVLLSEDRIENINDTYQADVNLRFYETSSQEDERL